MDICICVLACCALCVSRCAHVCLRARRPLNICFTGPQGAQLAELPALRAVYLTAWARPPGV